MRKAEFKILPLLEPNRDILPRRRYILIREIAPVMFIFLLFIYMRRKEDLRWRLPPISPVLKKMKGKFAVMNLLNYPKSASFYDNL